MVANNNLHPLLTDISELKTESNKRKKEYDFYSVKPDQSDEYYNNGWTFYQKLKTKTKLKKLKPIDERLENKFWFLLYKMGYGELNKGRQFKIKIMRQGEELPPKQIDVFAKDDETVIVAECKASGKIRNRSLQKDIEEFANLKGPISNSIKRHYGEGYKPKIIWFFVTENIIWSQPDKDRASRQNIRIITEKELRYYHQIATHLGKAARYQFLAEFLKGQTIPELKDITVPAIRGKLGGKKFYCFVTTPKQLLKISFVNHRTLNDPEGAPTYQRLISRTRLKQIEKFLTKGGFFPNNLLMNFIETARFEATKKDENTDVTFGALYLPDKYRSAWIIDGQHRLYGFSHLDDKYLSQNIMAIAFEKIESHEEANMFVTINHEQKTVPKNLLDDLEGELRWGSKNPFVKIGAIASRLVGLLNQDIGEPFYNRITQQGIKSTDHMCLTLPAIKDGLKRSGLIGSVIFKSKVYEYGPLSGENDYKTLDRARDVLNKFFSIIKEAKTDQWDLGKKGFLCINRSIHGYLLFLSKLIKHMEQQTSLDAKELSSDEIICEIQNYLEPLVSYLQRVPTSEFEHTFNVKLGTGGYIEYCFQLCNTIYESDKEFCPAGFLEWKESKSIEKIETADRKLKELNIAVQKYIFDKFKDSYGTDKDAYWEYGVSSKDIKSNAYEKSLDNNIEDRLPLENYLEFIEYKKIIENKEQWPKFKSVFDIPEKGQKGVSKKLKWMETINELRRIPAHATEKRNYKVEDFDYIDYIYDELCHRIKQETELAQSEITFHDSE